METVCKLKRKTTQVKQEAIGILFCYLSSWPSTLAGVYYEKRIQPRRIAGINNPQGHRV
jgi:hypothetical protein